MQWHMPIGYKIVEGRIVIDEREEKIVREIFEEYEQGKAASAIAQNLMKRQIPNGKGRISWTHASVGKILENHNYLGTEYYPQMIEHECFDRVQRLREQVRADLGRGKYRTGIRERGLFQGRIICGECGAVYGRYQMSKHKGKKKTVWRCHNYIYQNQVSCKNGAVDDKILFEACVAALNAMIREPYRLCRVQKKERGITKRYRDLEKRIKTESIQSRKQMLELLQERAAESYRGLTVDDAVIQTERLKYLFEGRQELAEFEETLFQQTIEKIIIQPESTIEVVFQNTSRYETGYESR